MSALQRKRPAEPDAEISHNLLGQRLGRKGRGTRERILAAAERLLADPDGETISLSAVAREASLGMTTLYLYFGDLTELVLAVLDPVAATAEDAFIGQLRARWPEEELEQRSLTFLEALYAFWRKHSRILHLRNSQTSAQDPRLMERRVRAAQPIIDLFMFQMDADPADFDSLQSGMATALLTGIERLLAVATDTELPRSAKASDARVPTLLRGQARLLELGIRHGRENGRRRRSAAG